jgi:predicted component of type VI protein secretion system
MASGEGDLGASSGERFWHLIDLRLSGWLRRELQDNPKQVLEREIGRKLSKEELTAALAELKKHGIDAKPERS